MAYKGTASKSSSGASMSKYDVEVEARLKALEAQAHPDRACTDGDEIDVCLGGTFAGDKFISIINRTRSNTTKP